MTIRYSELYTKKAKEDAERAEELRMMAKVDIGITTYNRCSLLRQTVESIIRNTVVPYRLFIVDDHSSDGTADYLCHLSHEKLHGVVINKQRKGVSYGLNILRSLSQFYDWFYGKAQYFCYLQDDALVRQKGWLSILIDAYEGLKDQHPIGFLSGFDSPEHHPIDVTVWKKRPVMFKPLDRATCLMGEKTFWDSIGLIPPKNPDGTKRGFPDGNPHEVGRGRGSNIDHYLIGDREKWAAPNSCRRQGRLVMVIPGLIEHLAEEVNLSTWR